MTERDEAEILNDKLSHKVHELLSRFGRKAYYPKRGIPGQTEDARKTRINATLGQAFTDERRDGKLVPLLIPSFLQAQRELKPEEIFPYAPSHGIEPLRVSWASEIWRKSDGTLDGRISKPVVTNGIAHGLTIIDELFVEPGDELIHFNPFWGNYRLHFKDAQLKALPINNETGGLNLEELEKALWGEGKKKILLLNFPSNPTGYTPTREEIKDLQRIVYEAAEARNRILAIVDDAYFGLSYSSTGCKESPFSYLASLHENVLAIKADGATKECFAWGLRTGFLTFGRKGMTAEEATALEDKVAGRVRASISNVSTASQWTIYHGLRYPQCQAEIAANREVLQRRWKTMKGELDSHPEYKEQFTALPFNGGYFMCTQLKDADPETVRGILRQKYDTGVLSLGGTKLLRLAYSAVPNNELPELLDNIYQACREAA